MPSGKTAYILYRYDIEINATFKINQKLVHCASKSTSETSIEGVQNKVELSLEMTADGSN